MKLLPSFLICCVMSATWASPLDSIAADAKKMIYELEEIQEQLNAVEVEVIANDGTDGIVPDEQAEVLDPDADLRAIMMMEFESDQHPSYKDDNPQSSTSPKPNLHGFDFISQPESVKLCGENPCHSKNSAPISATITCKREYQLGEDVYCRFDFTNNDKVDYHLLKRYTPLEGMRYNYLTVTQGGRPVHYDGLLINRNPPTEDEYILVKARETVSAKVDLSLAYAMNATGRYEVKLNAPIHVQYHKYTQERCELQSDSEFVDKQEYTMTLESNPVLFELAGFNTPKKTMGEYHRQLESLERYQVVDSQQGGAPRDPSFIGGSATQKSKITELHRAMYYYFLAGLEDVDDNPNHYIKWFGKRSTKNVQKVKSTLQTMINAMSKDFQYQFNTKSCRVNYWNAYTNYGTTKVTLCNPVFSNRIPDILGQRTKLCTLVHEFAHAVASINNGNFKEIYYKQPTLNLAKSNPWHAVNNAENYCYFIETVNIFDYGHDSMGIKPGGTSLYVTRGNMYLRYTDTQGSKVADGYPKLLRGNWDNLPESFYKGFDTMVGYKGHFYISKGNQFVCYTCKSKTAQSLDNYGKAKLTGAFRDGFDSATYIGINRWVTKGGRFLVIDYARGTQYPLLGNMGIPSNYGFRYGFDSMQNLGNGKLYITKGKYYMRVTGDYSHWKGDPGYPRPIRGNWGKIKIPGHTD